MADKPSDDDGNVFILYLGIIGPQRVILCAECDSPRVKDAEVVVYNKSPWGIRLHRAKLNIPYLQLDKGLYRCTNFCNSSPTSLVRIGRGTIAMIVQSDDELQSA